MKTKKNLTQIKEFMNLRSYALIGASTANKKFGNFILKALRRKQMEVYLIHRSAKEIEGTPCYPDIESLPVKPDGVILVIPPREAEKALESIHAAGIKNVWLQQGSQSSKAVAYCIANDINYVSGECILMFLDHPGFPHNLHRWIWNMGAKT